MTAPAVTFNFADWTAMFPEFATVASGAAQGYFSRATMFCKNSLNPVPDVNSLTILLYLLTSHICFLNNPVTPAGASPSTPPGRIASATEGSVSASFELQYPPGTASWYNSSKYGAEYYAMTANYRTFRYKPGCAPQITLAMIPWLYGNTGS